MHSPLTFEEWSALVLSLRVALAAWMVCLLPGIALGWLLARKVFPGKMLLDAAVHLPLVLPPVAIGYLLLLAIGRSGPLGAWLQRAGIELAFTWRAAALASAVMAFPLMVRSVRLAVELVDPGIEAAARTLGASPWRVLLTITLPMAAPGLVTGSILTFARSLGEFGATIVVAGNILGQTRTLPLAIFTYTQMPGGDARAMRLMLISLAISFLSLLVSEWLLRRAARRRGRQ